MAIDTIDSIRSVMAVMRDKSLNEEAKERWIQAWAIFVLRKGALMIVVSAAIVILPWMVLMVFHTIHLASVEDSWALMKKWETIVIVAVLTGGLWLIRR